ncbi:outer membrane beta-barrel protein [Chitinophaga agrisoli]|uniref:Outer membrane beta-barrel protein n=1 Tax=Chitinophaga agrisoli TaxID=2607653 RepID=A0A5B2VMI6_9BACT|nr:outer membrane beta-barrel family protein [Chitinophaga agrisoli]KAA2240195.1 outer membrane beta-barrel protein [Chitinophaga agrisoli]
MPPAEKYSRFALSVLVAVVTAAGPVKAQITPKDTVLPKDRVTLKTVEVNGVRPFIIQSADRIILNVAESPSAAGSNAYDIMQRTPGALADANGNITVRGQSVTVWIDGRPSNLSGDDLKTMLQSMNSAGIDKIEVITHPSARYDAQGGVIVNIKTMKGRSLGANGIVTAGLGAGRFARSSTGISMNYRSAKTNVYGSYDLNSNQQYYDNLSTRYLSAWSAIEEHEYDKRLRYNNSFKLGLDHDFNKTLSAGVLVRGAFNYRNRDVNNRSQLDTDSLSIVQTKGKASYFSPTANAWMKKTFSPGRELSLNLDYFHYGKSWKDDLITNFYDRAEKPYRQADSLRDNSPADNNVYAISVDYTHPAKWAKIETGLKYTRTSTDNNVRWEYADAGQWRTDEGKTNHFIFQENIGAAYVSLSKGIGKYSLQAGLRAEQTNTTGRSLTLNERHPNNYFYLFPNLALQYMPSMKHVFGLGYKKNIVRYGFDYVNPFIIYQSRYTYSQGNSYLRPQIDNSIEGSYAYNSKLFITLTGTASRNALAPVYRQDTAAKLIISSYDNLSKADIMHLTVTHSASIGKTFTAMNTLGAMYVSYNGGSGASALDNQAFAAYVSSNATIRLPWAVAELTGFYVSPLASGIFKMSAMFKLDAGVSKSILQQRGSLKLSVTDLFNTQRMKYRVENYQQVNADYYNKTETRFVNLVFIYKFGNQYVKPGKNRKTGIDDVKARMGGN